ncbi:FAD/NAD(P)-binding domain-containing protein [Sistotremastrum suecicum HHB10207 ss-3]|uniref:FAD/NAD(P)-binding domain-containing protein n=1 Tax=Sistotremastrum suecicum HHB10207 ss-3 TaxID=1314776 RepID=A0A165Y378_9AGAM|nr:FAD/NAD(P)-binding domain-containing protein [Sistotremastrum suecicum HHB10207 ss-3]
MSSQRNVTASVDPYSHLQRALLRNYLHAHADILKQEAAVVSTHTTKSVSRPLGNLYTISSTDSSVGSTRPTRSTPRVGIIGAGMAGLYIGLILQSLDIDFKILEASNRVGGRLYTYRFSDSVGERRYEYYDVGAMRFPDTRFMTRTFNLMRNRGLDITLIPYHFQSDNTFRCYNGYTYPNGVPPAVAQEDQEEGQIEAQNALAENPFRASSAQTPLQYPTLAAANAVLSEILNEPRQLFVGHPMSEAITLLINGYDSYSMRTWVKHRVPQLSTSDILWLETVDKSTGWYDRGLVDTVLESLAFDWPQPPPQQGLENPIPEINWFCIDNGSSNLPEQMAGRLQGRIERGALVTKIIEEGNFMRVNYTEQPNALAAYPPNEQTDVFSAVICTVPLPRLSFMDLDGCGIMGHNYSQWSAIRQLRYGPSIKIAIRFTNPWWEHIPGRPAIIGGQSFTDLPIRTVVYPSYPPNGKNGNHVPKSPVLIVSYCWTNDAERLSALIRENGRADPCLIPLVLRDLAKVHNIELAWLKDQYDDQEDGRNYHAWSWLSDPLSAVIVYNTVYIE